MHWWARQKYCFFPVWRAVGNILIFFFVDGGDGVLLLLLPSRWWLLLLIRCVNDLLAVTQVVLYKRCVSSTVPMCSSYPYYPSSLHVIAINVVPIVFVLVSFAPHDHWSVIVFHCVSNDGETLQIEEEDGFWSDHSHCYMQWLRKEITIMLHQHFPQFTNDNKWFIFFLSSCFLLVLFLLCIHLSSLLFLSILSSSSSLFV